MSLQYRVGLIPGTESEKQLAQLCPACGEAEVTNDWCITVHDVTISVFQ